MKHELTASSWYDRGMSSAKTATAVEADRFYAVGANSINKDKPAFALFFL